MNSDQKKRLEEIPELGEEKNLLGKWSSFFINRYRIVYLIIMAIFVWGIGAYFDLPRELQPEIILPYGHVFTTYTGAGPEEMENLVTNKIEKKMEELEDIKKITSSSGYGYSSVFLEFNQGVDMDEKLQKMREKVSTIQGELPEDANDPNVDSIETNNGPIMIVNISGDYDLLELKDIAEDMKDEIEKNSDISEVLIIGGLEREIKIIVDPQKLSYYNVSLDDIKNAISASNINFPGGDIELDNTNYNIRTKGEFTDVDQLNRVLVSYNGTSPLFLKDIAKIEDGYAKTESKSRQAVGLHEESPTMKTAVALSIKKKDDADIIKTSAKIREFIDSSRGEVYPDDLNIEISGDLSVYVKDSLGTVVDNSKSGLLLVIIVLFLFIGFKESLVVAFVIPLSIFVSLGLMKQANMTFNTITLFSLILAVGMLVDNAIVVMENVDRLRQKKLTAKEAAEVGTNQIAPAIMSSTLTTLAAFFPIMLTPGIMGEFIKPIPITVMFTLTASFIVAITITPALSAMALKDRSAAVKKGLVRRQIEKLPLKLRVEGSKIFSIILVFILSIYAFKDSEGPFMGIGKLSIIFGVLFTLGMALKVYLPKKESSEFFIVRKYSEILHSIVSSTKKRIIVLVIMGAAFVMSLALVPLGILKVEMFASGDNTRLYVDVDAPAGTDIETTDKIASQIEKRLFKYGEIKAFVSNVGITGADSFDSFGGGSGGTPNIARITIDLYDEDERDMTSIELAKILREDLKDITGADITVNEIQEGPPSGDAINLFIKGKNIDDMKMVASDFTDILKDIEGTRDTGNSLEGGIPQLEIVVDKEKAAYLGLDDRSVALSVRSYVNGLKAATFRQNQEEIDIMIRSQEKSLESISDLENIYFTSRSGVQVPFNQVARVIETKGASAIRHDEGKRYASVYSGVKDGYIPIEITRQFREKIENYILPSGIELDFSGEQENLQETFMDMFMNMIIAGILVYTILAIQFNSLSQPMIILFAVPLSMIGVMPGLVLTGNTFQFVSFVGVVALVGIAVNDAIVLVDYINYLRKNGYELKEAIKKTGATRFLPVMATTITTTGGILPITMKQEFFEPMGYALIFGLSVATVLTLVVVPVLYSLFEEHKMKKRGIVETGKKGGLTDEKEIADVALVD